MYIQIFGKKLEDDSKNCKWPQSTIKGATSVSESGVPPKQWHVPLDDIHLQK